MATPTKRQLLRFYTDGTQANTHVFMPNGDKLDGVVELRCTVIRGTAQVQLDTEVQPINADEAADLIERHKHKQELAKQQLPAAATSA